MRGRVQGVGFRAATCREGRQLGLAGWVRNLPDGAVEVVAEGGAHEVDALLAFLQRGPRGARVTAVDASHEPPTGAGPPIFELR